MESTLEPTSNNRQPHQTAVFQSKAVAEIQARIVSAKNYPRNQNAAFASIIESCERISLAQTATYKYPRGGEIVTGPSIRLAEILAQKWGNIAFGIDEVEQREGESVMRALLS